MVRFWKVAGKLTLLHVLMFAFATMVTIPFTVIAVINIGMEQIAANPEVITEWLEENMAVGRIMHTLSSATAIGAALIMYTAFERKQGWKLGFLRQGAGTELAAGLGLGILFISAGFLIILSLQGVRIVDAAFNSGIAVGLLLDLMLFVTVGFSEEIFSRGYVYGLVKRNSNIVTAVIVSSLLFAFLHSLNPAVFSTPFPIINLFLAGVLLALLREWSGGLWLPIGVHITWNFFQGDVYGMAVSGLETESILKLERLNEFISGGEFGLEGSFADTIVSAAAIAVLIVLLRRRRAGAT
ncbi:CPBP family intramembrane glutamic endopeptidase [Paenibacillus alkalitolerans]|uniref:CPBP family intramembrane glutamic endopeptidase n=1 Tax=Paenibacillus alkalitolerans TaxID=2799335 RepID=UPI0018F373EF|nr:CPBP family intramembrane glutamic endopeptidase [Paenibacillus alkalitolerans]